MEAKDHPAQECLGQPEIKEELKQFMENNENEDTSVQNLWDMAKVVLSRKYIAIKASLKKTEKSRIYQLSLYLNWKINNKLSQPHT